MCCISHDNIYIYCMHKMKTKNHTVGTIQKSNIKAVDKDKIGAPNTHI